jgi:putative transcriptional regulator
MIRCHLARLLGERKLKMNDVAKETGVNRGTLSRMYYETAERYDAAVLDVLCAYLKCTLSELLEYEQGNPGEQLTKLGPRRTG